MTLLATAAASSGGNSLSILILVLPVVVLVWLILTQRRRQKAVNEAQASLSVGDEVMVAAGIYGTVTQLDGDVVHMEIAPGVVVRVNRRAVVPPTGADRPAASAGRDDAAGEKA